MVDRGVLESFDTSAIAGMRTRVNVTVLVPTYRRPGHLARCLEALRAQTRLPDEVLVVVRDTDHETRDLVARLGRDPLPIRTVEVAEPGVIAAMNDGLAVVRGEIVALTDDDAAPHPDWLERIEAHFKADPEVGGVGGRDWIYHGEQLQEGSEKVVGKVQWFGRMIGNHHWGVGGPREVDVLKGVNCAYRRDAIRPVGFDERLMGTGAQVHWELSLGLRLRRLGWKLIYDPAVAVDHHEAPRQDENLRPFHVGRRNLFDATTFLDYAHNQTLIMLTYLSPMQKLAFIVWTVCVGTRDAFGLVQWLRFLPREGSLAGKKLRAALRGGIEGWRTWRRRPKP